MAALPLKHLLNHDEDSDTKFSQRPILDWNHGDFMDPIPLLPVQSWDSLVGEMFGSESFINGVNEVQQHFTIESEALRETQEQIELWTAGNMAHQLPSPDQSPPREETYICYGTVFRSAVKLCGNMSDLDKKLTMAATSAIPGHTLLRVTRPETQWLVAFDDGHVLGEVNASLEQALNNVAEQQYALDYEVFAPVRAIRETITRATKEKDAIVRVQISVYGLRSTAQDIGREFSKMKIYLQRPDSVRDGAEYDNPHELKLVHQQSSGVNVMIPAEDVAPEKVASETLKQTIADVYSSLTRDKNLQGLEGDERLKTRLLPHQKTALDFMTQRENGPIQDAYLLWRPAEVDGQPCHRHAVTNTICRLEPPEETGGGILADEMGMGKSLSVLALILRTLEAAHQWATKPNTSTTAGWTPRPKSSATLIVASSDLMINEWFLELRKHFDVKTLEALRMKKYHGQNRERSEIALCDADIVITTYHTLASEVASSTHLVSDIEWYRLVLDEAHIIRRQSTGLNRAVSCIAARSRWCLTGTPVQNRLEDIGSLLAFLRADPFHALSTFRKFIALPFDEGGKRRKVAIERFTRLLDSICLRRSKDLLHLPDPDNVIRPIVLSPEERSQYDQTKKVMMRAIKHQHGVFDAKSTLGLFQVQLQLRILCNHGTWQQQFSWSRRKLHLLDEREAVEASVGRDGERTCSACRQTMPLFGTGSFFSQYAGCRHVLCSECVDQSQPEGHDPAVSRCPLCSSLWHATSKTHRSKHTSQEDMYFRPDGRSSKMEALMTDVMHNIWTTKSIIFTCWTRTLDLVQHYLREAGLTHEHFQRIDGECPTVKREKILDDFINRPSLSVLIMTTGTGAVGLNLATANRVFLFEPQWNPSVENQAIARALRLGQESAVLVIRYVVDQSIEVEMRSLQDQKRARAQLVERK